MHVGRQQKLAHVLVFLAKYCKGVSGLCLLPSPYPAAVAILEVNEWMENLSVCVFPPTSAFEISKSF